MHRSGCGTKAIVSQHFAEAVECTYFDSSRTLVFSPFVSSQLTLRDDAAGVIFFNSVFDLTAVLVDFFSATQRLTPRGKLDVILTERHQKSADLSLSGGPCVLFETMIPGTLNPKRK